MTRVGAVITEEADLQRRGLDFFVPTLNVASSSAKNFSHIYLKELHQYGHGLDKPALIRLPNHTVAESFLGQLSSLSASFVVVVPVVENFTYWKLLQRYQDHFDYVLSQPTPVSAGWTRRFMCLRYISIVVNHNFSEQLALKQSQPDLLIYLDEADSTSIAIARAHATKIKEEISMMKFVNHLIEPLQPLTEQMPLEVYQTFEEDRTKYDAYVEAIDLAMSDITHLKSEGLRILVIGPGRGPLLATTAKYLDQAEVIAIERNPKCLPKLEDDNKRLWDGRVQIIEGDVRVMAKTLGEFDLIVSELLGSFGCNEACPEILASFASSKAVMIPQTVRCLIRPIFTASIDKDYSRPYLLKSDQSYEVGNTFKAFEFNFPGQNALNQDFKTELDFQLPDIANAIEGIFKADLYGHISISNAHLDASTHVCSSWYPMVFPTSSSESGSKFSIWRKSSEGRLWYEWAVNGVKKNSDGSDYFISLA